MFVQVQDIFEDDNALSLGDPKEFYKEFRVVNATDAQVVVLVFVLVCML